MLKISYYTLATKLMLEARSLVSYLNLYGGRTACPNPRASFSQRPPSLVKWVETVSVS